MKVGVDMGVLSDARRATIMRRKSPPGYIGFSIISWAAGRGSPSGAEPPGGDLCDFFY